MKPALVQVKACGANGADLIYDAVGGGYAEAALRAIAWEGRFLVVGFPAGIPKIPLNLALLKSCATKTDMYYDVDQASELSGVFSSIAQNLANLRIAR
jgi:NADPH:quinone reductase-like Zn-dependent oxidoreductase